MFIYTEFMILEGLTKDFSIFRSVFVPVEAWILKLRCMRFKQLCDLPHCLLPVCGVWVLRNIPISTPLFTGWRIPRCSQGALYSLLSDMVIQLFRNGTPFFLPQCLC